MVSRVNRRIPILMDLLLSIHEGLQKAIDLLRRLIFREEKAEMWWA